MLLLLAQSPRLAADDLAVVVTIKPIHALVSLVMEGAGTPRLLVAGAQSPHTFALKPSDAEALNDASVVFRVSDSVEPFTRRLPGALPTRVRIISLAEADELTVLDARQGGAYAAHDHHLHSDEGEGHGGEAVHEARLDGHVWLDPGNARRMVDLIAVTLGELAPEKKAMFEANAAKTKAALSELESSLARDLEGVTKHPFIVLHDATQYFEHRFGLSAAGAIAVSPDVPPSAKRLTELRRRIADAGVVCVFAEPGFSDALVRTVTDGTGARPGRIDPEGLLVAPGPAAYDALMRNLARDMASCLSAS